MCCSFRLTWFKTRRVHRVPKRLRDCPAGYWFWFGAGGHAGCHVAPVAVQQVEQGRRILLSGKTLPLWGHVAHDGGHPRSLSSPDLSPGNRNLVWRAEAYDVSCFRWDQGLGVRHTVLTGVYVLCRKKQQQLFPHCCVWFHATPCWVYCLPFLTGLRICFVLLEGSEGLQILLRAREKWASTMLFISPWK